MFRWLETCFKIRLDVNKFFFNNNKCLDILIPSSSSINTQGIYIYPPSKEKTRIAKPKNLPSISYMLLLKEKEIQKERAYETIALPTNEQEDHMLTKKLFNC